MDIFFEEHGNFCIQPPTECKDELFTQPI